MRYRPLGPTGVLVSELSFGCGHLPDDEAASTIALRAGIAAGCNYFETAECYLNGQCQQKTALGVRGFTEQVMVSACPNKLPIMEQLNAVRGLFEQEMVTR